MKRNLRLSKLIAIGFVLLFGSGFVIGQIAPGDIAIVGINTDNPDAFGFVTLGDIPANTSVFFTDNGVLEDGSLRTGEGTLEWSHTDIVSEGTVVTRDDLIWSLGTSIGTNPSFAASGDQVIVYTGSDLNPTYIFVLNIANSGWVSISGTEVLSTTSYLPAGFIDGTNAIHVANVDNGYYSGVTEGSSTDLLGSICDNSNWTTSNDRIDVLSWPNSFNVYSTTWTGEGISENWDHSNNWTNGVPTLDFDVTIPTGLTNYPTISSSASCNNILIESGASLIGAENLTVGGTATMQRSIPKYNTDADGWHLLSSPVNNMTISGSDFVPGAADDFYAWGESTYTWLNQKVGANSIDNFVNGQGYLVAYENTNTKGFVGAFNNADVTHANLSKTADKGDGWHLLGNPFQSALQWTNTDWVRTNISAGAKIMNSGGSYSDITVGLVDIIPANQGFMVQALDAINTITIPVFQRVHSYTAFYKSEPANVLSLKASDGDFYVETWIQIMDGATLGFDAQFDMNFLGGMQNAPYLYSAISETEKLSTNRIAPIEQLTEVPLAFKSFLDNDFTISTNNANSFESDIDVFLKDKVANVSINLKVTPEYTFSATAGELTDRFVIQLFKSSTNIPTIELSGVQIFSNGEQVFLRSDENNRASLTVYNMLGQEVYFKIIVLGGLQTIDLNQKAGWYIVQLVGEQGLVKEKVFLK